MYSFVPGACPAEHRSDRDSEWRDAFVVKLFDIHLAPDIIGSFLVLMNYLCQSA